MIQLRFNIERLNCPSGRVEFCDTRDLLLHEIRKAQISGQGMFRYPSEDVHPFREGDSLRDFLSSPELFSWFKALPEEYQSDLEFISAARKVNTLFWNFVPSGLQDHAEFIVDTIHKTGAIGFGKASKRLQDDFATVLEVIKIAPFSLQYASERLRDDPRILLAVCSRNPALASSMFGSVVGSSLQSAPSCLLLRLEEPSQRPQEVLEKLLAMLMLQQFYSQKQLDAMLEKKKYFPKIAYQGHESQDYWGLSRDVVSRLFRALASSSTPGLFKMDGFCFPEYELEAETKDTQRVLFYGIGAIFACALRGDPITTGMIFDHSLFDMLSRICLEGTNWEHRSAKFDSIFTTKSDLLGEILLHNFRHMFSNEKLTIEESKIIIAAFLKEGKIPLSLQNEGISSKEEFFTGYSFIKRRIYAALWITKSMVSFLGLEKYHQCAGLGSSLSTRIQGSLSKEQIMEAVQWDEGANQALQNFVVRWINEASLEELEAFVYAVSGSYTLSLEQKVTVSIAAKENRPLSWPIFQTCSLQMIISEGYALKPYEVFQQNLNKAVSHIQSTSSFV